MIGCFNKKGAKISRSEWNKRQRTKSYRIEKEYSNDDIYLIAEWHGVASLNLERDDRVLYRLTVEDMANGQWAKDVSLGGDYRSVDNMLAEYEKILLKYTQCELDDDFEFVEKGNPIEPPPPPKPKPEPKPTPTPKVRIPTVIELFRKTFKPLK